ncbi:XdhC family protein [Rouxiella sp. Mn2063]|uniref:XdhC family protein n=1 Tax=Rouxiella sp. Mn2063 TaxID=3395262 RepID=UPI003BC692CE
MNTSTLPQNIQIIEQALNWSRHEEIWLCTVLQTWGSSPRSPGALMVANARGEWCGSLSGGCVEESFLSQLKNGDWREASQVVRYGADGLQPDISLPCGGKLDILIEYLPAGSNTSAYLEQLHRAFMGYQPVCKTLVLPAACQHISPCEPTGHPAVIYDAPQVTIWHDAAPCLFIAGYSSVAEYCISFGYALGFEVIVCEPREEIFSKLAHTLPKHVRLITRLPATYLETEGCHARTAIVALTHDARMDDLTLMEAVNTPAFYIGAMGSKNNSQKRFERLTRVAGLSETELARIHAPIGLDLGSKTPAEIALSVLADIVSYKNGL